MTIHISKSNTKLGSCLNVSFPPLVTCRKDVPCRKDCYALKAYRMYPGTRTAWDENLEFYKKNPDGFFFEIYKAIKRRKKPGLFRWLVSGDIPGIEFLDNMVHLAYACPETKFLAFSKRYEFLLEYGKQHIPGNLKLVVSMWPGLKVPDGLERFPTAWMRDCRAPDKRIPKAAKECPGKCATCGLCWKLPAGKSVVFARH